MSGHPNQQSHFHEGFGTDAHQSYGQEYGTGAPTPSTGYPGAPEDMARSVSPLDPADMHGGYLREPSPLPAHPGSPEDMPPSWQGHNPGHDIGNGYQSLPNTQGMITNPVDTYEDKPSYYLNQAPTEPMGPPRRGFWGACKDWGWEVGAALFSLCCIAAVIGVLAVEDGRTLDQWSWSVGPTAVVSFLGTLAKIFLLVGASEALSQMKWQHYENRSNPLGDLQLFDWASRGPFGAIQLVILKNVKSFLGSLAALMIIVAVLVDPFMQLVFSFPSISAPDSSEIGTFATTRTYDPSDKYIDSHSTSYIASAVDINMQAAIIGAVSGSSSSPAASCTTGNCTWADLTTLGVCSSCSDITSQVTVVCPSNSSRITCYYYLPSGAILQGAMYEAGATGDYFPTRWNSTASALRNGSDIGGKAGLASFEAVQLLADFDYDTFNMTSVIGVPTAWQCEFHLCTRTLESVNMTNGDITVYEKEQVSLVTLNETQTLNVSSGFAFIQAFGPDTTTATDDAYWLNDADWSNLGDYLVDLFTCGWGLSGFGASTAEYVPNFGQWFADADMTNTTSDIASAMTEIMRTSRNGTLTDGLVYRTRAYIHVTWGWLALPIIMSVLSMLLVIAMIIRSSRSGLPAWKESNLALLYHRVDGWPPRPPNGGNFRDHHHDLRRQTKDIMVSISGQSDQMVFATAQQYQQSQEIQHVQ